MVFTDSLILMPMLLISSFHLIAPIFLNAEGIISIDSWLDALLGFNKIMIKLGFKNS